MKIGPMMHLAEIAAHTMHLEKCWSLVATLLGLEDPQKTEFFLYIKMEVGFIWGSKEVKETWYLLNLFEHLDCHS